MTDASQPTWRAVLRGDDTWHLMHTNGEAIPGHKHEAVAVEMARLINHERYAKLFAAWPPPSEVDRSEVSAEYARIREAALRFRPPAAARPFLVEIVKRSHIVVLAEDEDDASAAVESFGREELAGLLESAFVDWDITSATASDALGEIGTYTIKGQPTLTERAFVAVEGRLYSPESHAATLYLDERPTDHGYRCPARPRDSNLGDVVPGPCNCDVRAFPRKPGGAA